MTDEEAIQIHVLKILGKCPRLTAETQTRITWEALDSKNKNRVEAERRVKELENEAREHEWEKGRLHG